jgi:hypothetical protein
MMSMTCRFEQISQNTRTEVQSRISHKLAEYRRCVEALKSTCHRTNSQIDLQITANFNTPFQGLVRLTAENVEFSSVDST